MLLSLLCSLYQQAFSSCCSRGTHLDNSITEIICCPTLLRIRALWPSDLQLKSLCMERAAQRERAAWGEESSFSPPPGGLGSAGEKIIIPPPSRSVGEGVGG